MSAASNLCLIQHCSEWGVGSLFYEPKSNVIVPRLLGVIVSLQLSTELLRNSCCCFSDVESRTQHM